jgi:hypothetical protein
VLHRVELAGGDDADQLRLGQRDGQARLAASVASVGVDERPVGQLI